MKDIKDYLHLYLGCEVLHQDGTTAKLVSVTTMNECAFIHNETNQFGVSTPDGFGKLVLRRLSDMSEEEKLQYRRHIRKFSTDNILPVIKSGNLCNEYHSRVSDEATWWLLSKSFDLFGLIDAGLAIDAKTFTD